MTSRLRSSSSRAGQGRRRAWLVAALLSAGLMEVLYARVGESLILQQVGPMTLLSATGAYPYYCGDNHCLSPENALNCPVDCPARCGDRICSPGEVCASDCAVSETCGNKICEPWEERLTCPADCAPGCGDTTCADTESCDSCPIDCCPGPLPAECGNGLCEGPKEGPDSCPEDCGQPPTGPIPPPPPPPVCGDNRCDLGESPCNCQADCGPPAPGANCLCGNGLCERGKGETCVTCAADCGSCAPPSTGVCGNLICEEDKHENCSNCNLDCGACPVFEDTEIPEPPSDPSLQFDGLDPNFQEHFVPDLSSEDYPFPILGDTTHEVATPLSRPTGERDVVYRKVGGGGSTVLNTASPSWNLLAAGIQLSGGRTAVCWNRLVGTDSAATHGTMPDPRGGVALLCRTWNGTAWGAEQVISAGQPASWLQELKLNAQGKAVVVYLKDSFGTLFNTGKPGDGIVEVILP